MNIERLNEIACWLEAGAPHKGVIDGFDMSSFINPDAPCGTTCCIAGAAICFAEAESVKGPQGHIDSQAEVLLGLTPNQGYCLFYAETPVGQLGPARTFGRGEITAAWAARTIRHLISTGVVDWEATRC